MKKDPFLLPEAFPSATNLYFYQANRICLSSGSSLIDSDVLTRDVIDGINSTSNVGVRARYMKRQNVWY